METILKIKVSPGKKKFRAKWNETEDLLLINTRNKAEKGKANLEIVKELSKLLGTQIKIVSGAKGKNKLLKINLGKREALRKINAN